MKEEFSFKFRSTKEPSEGDVIRFFSYVEKTEYCWNWIGGRKSKSEKYGAFSLHGKTILAHRVSFLIANRHLPASVLDHICRNQSCVNPSHLRPATMKQNAIENSASASALNAQKTHCKHGHEFTFKNTYLYLMKTGGQARICKKCISIRGREKRIAMKAGK